MVPIVHCLLSVLLLVLQLYGTDAMETRDMTTTAAALNTHQVHIVYMGGVNEETTTNHAKFHASMLQEAMGSADDVSHHILYSYTKSFNGFAVVCSDRHAESIRRMEGVVSVFKSQMMKPQTTNSWTFLGLSPTQGIWPRSSYGAGIILGLIDTGIWPESKSFNDDGFGSIPARWKGECVKGDNFTASLCNKKLIGAKFYDKGLENQAGPIDPREIKSPLDSSGHGTHTSSTAAGRKVADASFLGVANGTATGGAPEARVAMYKVCWFDTCNDADVLAALHDAIADGVDVLSISLGARPMDYLNDVTAIGAFHAVAQGIVVSCSAGNSGPSIGTVLNTAPWIFTVGASTTDRVFEAAVDLGNGVTVPGIAINTFEMNSSYPLVYAGDLFPGNPSKPYCSFSALNQTMAYGKIILCEGDILPLSNENLQWSGSVGYISITNEDMSVQFPTFMPSTNVNNETGTAILEYARSSENPMARIRRSETILNSSAPVVMAYFSSLGPNTITPSIHKPDITAPGVDILAGWSPVATLYSLNDDALSTNFNIISGTSMSCPHVSGLVALVKSVHPDWSPAAIKSAIMTTATPLDAAMTGNSPLASGSGQINPIKAADPGLIFNLTTTDYINFLCAIGYTKSQVRLISGGKETCPAHPPTVLDLNYPSIYVSTNLTVGFTHNISRTVTNVGPAPSSYTVSIDSPAGTVVQVEPSTLTFTKMNEEQSFHVILTVKNAMSIPYDNFGSITWISDGPNSLLVRMLIGVGSGLEQ